MVAGVWFYVLGGSTGLRAGPLHVIQTQQRSSSERERVRERKKKRETETERGKIKPKKKKITNLRTEIEKGSSQD